MINKLMQFKDFSDLFHTESDIINMGYKISNCYLESIDINILGRFGNIPAIVLTFTNGKNLFSSYNMLKHGGDFLKFLIEFLDLEQDSGVFLSNIKNVPVRLIEDPIEYNSIIGFGHFMKNKFIIGREITNRLSE